MICSLVLAGAGVVSPVLAVPANGAARALKLHNVWSKETITLLVDPDRALSAVQQRQLNHIMRDHHTGIPGKMDPALVKQLIGIQRHLAIDDATFYLLSAFRSRKTQAMLRRRGENVATNSLHLRGQAVDIKVPGVALRDLRNAAADLRAGGVGSYRRFVHLDSGNVRRW